MKLATTPFHVEHYANADVTGLVFLVRVDAGERRRPGPSSMAPPSTRSLACGDGGRILDGTLTGHVLHFAWFVGEGRKAKLL